MSNVKRARESDDAGDEHVSSSDCDDGAAIVADWRSQGFGDKVLTSEALLNEAFGAAFGEAEDDGLWLTERELQLQETEHLQWPIPFSSNQDPGTEAWESLHPTSINLLPGASDGADNIVDRHRMTEDRRDYPFESSVFGQLSSHAELRCGPATGTQDVSASVGSPDASLPPMKRKIARLPSRAWARTGAATPVSSMDVVNPQSDVVASCGSTHQSGRAQDSTKRNDKAGRQATKMDRPKGKRPPLGDRLASRSITSTNRSAAVPQPPTKAPLGSIPERASGSTGAVDPILSSQPAIGREGVAVPPRRSARLIGKKSEHMHGDGKESMGKLDAPCSKGGRPSAKGRRSGDGTATISHGTGDFICGYRDPKCANRICLAKLGSQAELDRHVQAIHVMAEALAVSIRELKLHQCPLLSGSATNGTMRIGAPPGRAGDKSAITRLKAPSDDLKDSQGRAKRKNSGTKESTVLPAHICTFISTRSDACSRHMRDVKAHQCVNPKTGRTEMVDLASRVVPTHPQPQLLPRYRGMKLPGAAFVQLAPGVALPIFSATPCWKGDDEILWTDLVGPFPVEPPSGGSGGEGVLEVGGLGPQPAAIQPHIESSGNNHASSSLRRWGTWDRYADESCDEDAEGEDDPDAYSYGQDWA